MKSEQVETVEINEEMQGIRVDMALSLLLPQTSRNYIQKLIRNGNVTVNYKLCLSKNYKTKARDMVQITIPEPEDEQVEGEDIPLDICYEDESLLVVNKPGGMVVHPAAGNNTGTLVNAVLHHCDGRLSSINGVIRPGIVHRIDKDTSGLLVIAKNDTAHRQLAKQFADHSITRTYTAIVYRNVKEDQGKIDTPIGRDPKNRLRQAVTETNSKPAVTHYKVLERFGKFTLVQAKLETGRTHQIRVHMAHIGHPILGDPLYGPNKGIMNKDGQMLHAGQLGFLHPETGQYMEFESAPPEEFRRVLEHIKEVCPP